MGAWTEECEQLAEEMLRCLRFLKAKSDLWTARKTTRVTNSEPLDEGLSAYAQHQSTLQNDLAIAFARDFEDALLPETKPSLDQDADDDDDGDDDETMT